MAERRMFTKKITDSDAFVELSSAAQALYFHLNQGADDDGFNNQIQNAMFKAHASTDDLKVLMAKNYIIRFESGVLVIKHWRMHNTLRKDRYTPTNFQEELKLLGIKDNGAYTLGPDESAWLPNGCQMVATGKVSIGKDSLEKEKIYKKEKAKENAKNIAIEVVEYLNSKCGTKYKTKSEGTLAHITARLSEGYTLEDFKTVIDKQYRKWHGTEYEIYLRPDTLFRPQKFDVYLNAPDVEARKVAQSGVAYTEDDGDLDGII